MKTKHPAKKRILIVDNHPLIVEGLVSLLGGNDGLYHTIKASNGKSALSIMRANRVDVAIIDYSLSDMNGAELIDSLRKINQGLHTIIYTGHDEPWVVKDIIDAGAEAVVLKDDNMKELVMAVESVCAGLPYFSNRFTSIAEQLNKTFSSREVDILQMMSAGMKSRDIACRLFISENTVEYHRKKMKQRLGAQNEAHLIAIAINRGIIKG